MLMRRTSRVGLGDWRINSSGEAVDCSLFSNLLQSVCWNPFYTAPTTLGEGLPVFAKAGPAPAIDPTGNVTAACAADPAGCVQSLLTAGFTADQAANLLASQNVVATCSSSIIQGICDTYVYIGMAAIAGLLVFMAMKGGR